MASAATAKYASVEPSSSRGGGHGGCAKWRIKAAAATAGHVRTRSHSTATAVADEEAAALLAKLYEKQPQRRLEAKSEADILNTLEKEQRGCAAASICRDQKAISDWMLHEPLYDRPRIAPSQPPRRRPPPNQHYYSSVPFELDVLDKPAAAVSQNASQKDLLAFKRPPLPLSSPSTMSITIKMGPRPRPTDLQMKLSDLNKLTSTKSRSGEVAEDSITNTTTSTAASSGSLNMAQFVKTKDFGDFQILSDSPERQKRKRKPTMVDV